MTTQRSQVALPGKSHIAIASANRRVVEVTLRAGIGLIASMACEEKSYSEDCLSCHGFSSVATDAIYGSHGISRQACA